MLSPWASELKSQAGSTPFLDLSSLVGFPRLRLGLLVKSYHRLEGLINSGSSQPLLHCLLLFSIFKLMATPAPPEPRVLPTRSDEISRLRQELAQAQGRPMDELRILRHLTELLLKEKENLEGIIHNQSEAKWELDRERTALSYDCCALRSTVRRLKWRLKKDPWVSTSEDSDSE